MLRTWDLILISAGILYPMVALVLNIELPVVGVIIIMLMARELVRRRKRTDTV